MHTHDDTEAAGAASGVPAVEDWKAQEAAERARIKEAANAYYLAKVAISDLKEEKLAAMQAAYPIGTEVSWWHGPQLRRGIVEGYQERGDNIWCRNPRTGKLLFTYIGRVIGFPERVS